MAVQTMPNGAAGSVPYIYNAAIFSDLWRGIDKTFFARLTGPAPSTGMVRRLQEEGRQFSAETDKGYPICRIADLKSAPGDKVQVDLEHAKWIEPVMGDAEIKGRRGTTSFASHEGKINAWTFGWDAGGKMAQKRTPYQLRPRARSSITRNALQYMNQMYLVHLAGARGYDQQKGWVIPLANADNFDDLMINPVYAPTHNRYMVAGGAATIADMDTTCFLKLQDIARMVQANRESEAPTLSVMTPNDPAAETSPLAVVLVTDRQWYWMEQYHSGTGKDWQTFLANAQVRGAKNPLFAGAGNSCGMWGGALIMRMPRNIRFGQGHAVTVATSADAYTETTVTVPTFESGGAALDYAVDRAVMLGAQALADLWGSDSSTGLPTDWYEGYENDNRRPVFSLQGIGGIFKLRFRDESGVDWDHGVWAMDSYAPNPTKVQSLT